MLKNYWIVWPVGIALWLLAGWAGFAWFESSALLHPELANHITLSFFLYTISSEFPLSIFLSGIFVGLFWGILGTHVLWHWSPPGSKSAG